MDYDGERIKEWAGRSQWRAWRADLARFRKWGYSGWGSEGFWALTLYRVQRSVRRARPRVLWLPVLIFLAVLKKLFTLVTHINLDADCDIGPGCLIPHVGPIRIGDGVRIGADCAIFHVCTIGAGARPGPAIIGDHVMIGCQSSILGPVRIGDRVNVAAQTLVLTDIPEGATAIGVPARVLPGRWRLSAKPASEAEPPRARPSSAPAICSTAPLAGEAADAWQAVLDHAGRSPERPAITLFREAGNYRVSSYRDLAEGAASLRRWLEALLPEGAPVMIFARRTPESVALMLAAVGARRPFSWLNPRWRWSQIRHVLALAGSDAVFVDADTAGSLPAGEAVAAGVRVLFIDELPAAGGAGGPGAPEQAAGGDRAGCYLFTSGSTGTPKGVAIAAADLYRRAATDVAMLKLQPGDVLLDLLPLSFDVGLNQVLAALLAGCETVLCPSFLPRDILTIAAERRVTGIPCVPSIWQDFVRMGLAFDRSGAHRWLRFVTISGGDMRSAELARMRGVVGEAEIWKTYGQTEAFRATALRPEEFDARPWSVGRPYPGVTVTIVRPDGSVAGRDEPGELVHSGLGVMLGYLGDAQGSQAKLRPAPEGIAGPSSYSGDQAIMDADGYVRILGRGDQMLKVKGNRVYPAEVRNLICETPGVRDAAVLVAEDGSGEKCLVAFVVPADRETRERIAVAVRERLPGYMVPAALDLVAEIPRTANGKPDTEALRPAALRLVAERGRSAPPVAREASSFPARIAASIAAALDAKVGAEARARASRLTDVLDSLAFMELVAEMQARHGLEIDLGDISMADMESVESLAAAMARSRGVVPSTGT